MNIPFTTTCILSLSTEAERAALRGVSVLNRMIGKPAATLRYTAERLLIEAGERLELGWDATLWINAADALVAIATRLEAGMVPAWKQAECAAFVAFAAGRPFGGHTAKAAHLAAAPVWTA